ncbi:MAG: purine-nucleoside phosphorylase, partial [Clostridia bacterium]|nr:purine-nucleoside phosphorylase [Clostridia bacterium]
MTKLQNAAAFIRTRTNCVPKIAIVLGSGLGGFADRVNVETAVEYAEIPDFPHSTVEGHAGRFLFGSLGCVPVVLMQGRVH